MFNPIKYLRNRKVGLILGSGGAKGISHISVIEFLGSLGIPIDMIAGSSIGSVIAALYCTGTLKDFKEDIIKIQWNEMLSLFDPVFPKSGLIEGVKILEYLSRYIPKDARIEDQKIPLAIVATDYYSGMPVVFKSGNILNAIRASISIPGVFNPIKYNDTLLIDGGVTNPLPVDVIKEMGAGITIAVNLHPTVHRKRLKNIIKNIIKSDIVNQSTANLEIAKTMEDIKHSELVAVKKDKTWMKSVEKWLGIGSTEKKKEKLPNIFEIISQSIDIMEYINTMLMLKYNKPTVLIQPELLDIPMLDFSKSSTVLTEGFLACGKARGTIIRKVKFWI